MMSVTWINHDVVAFEGPRLRARSLPLATGITVQYVVQGEPAEPWDVPVVFLHGLSDSWRSFAPVLGLLPEQRVLAFTQRGHRDVTQPRYGYAATDFADDLVAFLDAMGIPRAVLVGHSLGSTVVLRFALDYPERVAGLVLVGANATWQDNPLVEDLWENVVSHLTDPVDPEFVRAFQHSDRIPAERLEMMIAESLQVPVRVWQEAGRAIMAADITDELPRVTAPTLVIWGAEDPICSEEQQERLCALIPQAELLVYPDAGHNLHWEHPERFAVDLGGFLAGIG
jgi:pimeloyl-ACP methyl ester carboxylesterase